MTPFSAALPEGEKPGHPRFKSRFRYHSLTFKQYGNSFKVLEGGKKNRGTLVLAKLGHVKMVMHRAIKGTRNFGHRQTNSHGEVVCVDQRADGGKST